jgi:lanosterol synthase
MIAGLARAGGEPRASAELRRGVDYLARIQHADGFWEGEVVWNTMLAAQYALTAYLTGQELPADRKAGLAQYFRTWQLPDGSWGIHPESPGYLFTTTLTYVALRTLGHPPEEPTCARARAWIRRAGGALGIPTWGKLWLALMNLYGWDGVNPVLPELWLLPKSSALHPRRYYCHTRLIYLGIGALYAMRHQHPANELVRALRAELYLEPFGGIAFARHRGTLHPGDTLVPPSAVIRAGYAASRLAEKLLPRAVRERALRESLDRIRYELRTTRYACISPVNGLLNTLAIWCHDPQDPEFIQAFNGMDAWIWEDPEQGLRLAGARSQTWDSSFVVQAVAAGPRLGSFRAELERSFDFYQTHQITDELPDRERYFRDPRYGGFMFADRHHQWPVSDCTAEALDALEVILGETGRRLSDERLTAAARFVLLRQNQDGGFGSYERRRGGKLLEVLNPSEMYGSCMTERSYNECTASALGGLSAYLRMVPSAPAGLAREIQGALARGERRLRASQEADGSWAGFWGVHHVYGTLFGVRALRAVGAPPSDPALARARAWLRATQLPDGGWGEAWQGCLEGRSIPTPRSLVIQTAWGLLAACLAGEDDPGVLDPAARLLRDRQGSDGSWPREAPAGVFFSSAMLHYMLYKDAFSVWALGAYESRRG